MKRTKEFKRALRALRHHEMRFFRGDFKHQNEEESRHENNKFRDLQLHLFNLGANSKHWRLLP